MEQARGKVVKGGKDRNGRIRKFIEIPGLYYQDFDIGDLVRIKKISRQES